MRYSLLVTAGPHSDAAHSALAVAAAVVARGHRLYRVFFHQDGVGAASMAEHPALCEQWQRLIQKEEIDAVVCISAAERRGLISQDELDRGDAHFAGIAPGFNVSGLGQWADALAHSDRVLGF